MAKVIGSTASLLSLPETWEIEVETQRAVADAIRRGRLLLVLGAGASHGCGLPGWETLLKNICEQNSIAFPKGKMSHKDTAEIIQTKLAEAKIDIRDAVHAALYEKFDYRFGQLINSRLLVALGVLTMPGQRGGVRKVITYNYDDLLEQYLRHYGYVVRSTAAFPRWNPKSDVEVLHPHGFLSARSREHRSDRIILTRRDYDEVVGKNTYWRSTLVDLMSSHFCVFIGLSGEDDNLTSMLHEVCDGHVTDYPYWGLRFTSRGDKMADMWSSRRVKNVTLKAYDHLPDWLLQCSNLALEKEGQGL